MQVLKPNDTMAIFSGVASRGLARILPFDSTQASVVHPAGSPVFDPAGSPLPKFFRPGGDRFVNQPSSKSSSAFEFAHRPAAPTTVMDPGQSIAVEVISRNVALVPGELAVFYFRVSNSAPVGIWVDLSAENSLGTWNATICDDVGYTLASPSMQVPAFGKIIVTVEVEVPNDAGAEDRNRTSLSATPIIAADRLFSRMAG